MTVLLNMLFSKDSLINRKSEDVFFLFFFIALFLSFCHFDKFNAPLLNKRVSFLQKLKKKDSKLLNGSL